MTNWPRLTSVEISLSISRSAGPDAARQILEELKAIQRLQQNTSSPSVFSIKGDDFSTYLMRQLLPCCTALMPTSAELTLSAKVDLVLAP